MTDADLHALTGAYALDALDPGERARFEAHLEVCDTCPAEAATLQAAAARLTDLDAQAPPDALRARVLAAVADTSRALPPPVSLAARRDASNRRKLLGAGSVLAAAAVATGAFFLIDTGNDPPRVAEILAAADAVTLPADTDGSATAEVVLAPSLDAAVIRMTGMPAPEEGKTYQAWVIEGDEVIPSDTFEPSESGSITEVLVGAEDATGFGVTIEPDGGSPTGKPTYPTVVEFAVTDA